MGIAKLLFFNSTDMEKQTLHRRITPSQDQQSEQQERWNDLAEYLVSDLDIRTGCRIRTWIQGSYKFGTQIRPTYGKEFDIDLGVYFIWNGLPEQGSWEPKQLKDFVQNSLSEYSGEGVKEVLIPPKEKCSRIMFEGDFHIDAPAYHLNEMNDNRMLATEKNQWEDSDPKAIYVWFKEKFDDTTRSQVRRLIQYFKCWSGQKYNGATGGPSSILLTVLIAEAIPNIPSEAIVADDDALLKVVESLLKRLKANPTVYNPVNNTESLIDHLSEQEFGVLINNFEDLRSRAKEALSTSDLLTAIDKWTSIFGHFFPICVDELLKESTASNQLPIRTFIPEVRVDAVPENNSHRTYSKMNSIGPIPRECKISFNITNQNEIPGDARIEWVVRNEGEEAEYSNDLGHRAGNDIKAEETSRYNGTHYMDCIVKRSGSVIGWRRIPVVIFGPPIPRRNPKKKPAWVNLKKKKR
ncbi:MAG: hypothetical protein HOE90_16295 [Bacteriovoracaceae bacterium]|mgnify:CR=1 FL=1|jgi:hypothetical protein|nr:hypothetical protein [Bacteriovoracaceae bacterium]